MVRSLSSPHRQRDYTATVAAFVLVYEMRCEGYARTGRDREGQGGRREMNQWGPQLARWQANVGPIRDPPADKEMITKRDSADKRTTVLDRMVRQFLSRKGCALHGRLLTTREREGLPRIEDWQRSNLQFGLRLKARPRRRGSGSWLKLFRLALAMARCRGGSVVKSKAAISQLLLVGSTRKRGWGR